MNSITASTLKSVVGNDSGLGFGCMGITAFYGDSMPDDQALELLKGVYDSGTRHFDTAEVYQQGGKFNESILGEFFTTVPRDSYTVATKYWPQDTEHDYEYDTVKTALVQSLQRLQLDYVDLYYAHRVTSLELGIKFAKTIQRLKDEGLVKAVGLSEVSGKWLKQINEVCHIDAVQQEWSLMTRSLEKELVPVCKELGIVIVAYSPLSRNLLAKKLDAPPDDWRGSLPRYQKENLDKNQMLLDNIATIASKYNCTTAQLSLAWLFHKAARDYGVVVIPIPGSTKLSNVISNSGSVNIDIANDDIIALESLADQVAGERGSEWYMARSIENQK